MEQGWKIVSVGRPTLDLKVGGSRGSLFHFVVLLDEKFGSTFSLYPSVY